MLVLSRKLNESIVIADDIEVTVVEMRGNHVKLAISAPESVTILREELVEADGRAEIRRQPARSPSRSPSSSVPVART